MKEIVTNIMRTKKSSAKVVLSCILSLTLLCASFTALSLTNGAKGAANKTVSIMNAKNKTFFGDLAYYYYAELLDIYSGKSRDYTGAINNKYIADAAMR